ncbi:MAG: MogA/MoaB family molybdenum cofactor biosynthesis protein [Vicinamibacteraceae bacterium]|nr:MogA/MoaB family molybdenum cofactor biosynthesis protein [Vicinamibacteraceae bacterium]
MSVSEHKADAPVVVRCAVLTVSDTRTEATDTGGALAVRLLEAEGHRVSARRIVRDEPADVAAIVREWAGRPDIDVVITTGGTGLSVRDTTYEAVVALLDKRLDGFGELFRSLSYEEIGPAAMLSRAVAGSRGRTFIACLPGAEGAVRLAMTRLLVPELPHIVRELQK